MVHFTPFTKSGLHSSFVNPTSSSELNSSSPFGGGGRGMGGGELKL